jgi:hypothetical protein
MLSQCLHGDGWGVAGVEGVEEEVEEAGGRNGARVGSARRPATLNARCPLLNARRSTLSHKANADEFRVQRSESRCSAGRRRTGPRLRGGSRRKRAQWALGRAVQERAHDGGRWLVAPATFDTR